MSLACKPGPNAADPHNNVKNQNQNASTYATASLPCLMASTPVTLPTTMAAAHADKAAIKKKH